MALWTSGQQGQWESCLWCSTFVSSYKSHLGGFWGRQGFLMAPNFKFDLRIVSMCVLPLTGILMASEAMGTSKWPWRSKLTSKLNSVTSITYDAMLLWPVNALRWLQQQQTTNGANYDPLTLQGYRPRVKRLGFDWNGNHMHEKVMNVDYKGTADLWKGDSAANSSLNLRWRP